MIGPIFQIGRHDYYRRLKIIIISNNPIVAFFLLVGDIMGLGRFLEMPEVYKDLLYILKSGKAFRASGIVYFNEGSIFPMIEIEAEANDKNLNNEIVEDVLLNSQISERFFDDESISNRRLHESIPAQVLSEGVFVNIN